MRRIHFWPPLLVLTATVLWGLHAFDRAVAGDSRQAGGIHETAVNFGKAWEAAQRATQEKKLLLLVHISGMFEDPNFT